jgi:HSP20 family molecular chaperone IbpA
LGSTKSSVRSIASSRVPTVILPTTSNVAIAATASPSAYDKARQYIHRGIAARHFQRTFVLAEGMLVLGADLKNGLLAIDLARPEPEKVVKTIAINEHE